MASKDTARSLVLIGGLINLVLAIGMVSMSVLNFFLGFLGFGGFGWMMGPWMMMDFMPMFYYPMVGGFMIVVGILGILFGVLPLMWRDEPGSHRVGLITLGILSIMTIGGLFVFIGGIVAEEEAA